MARDSEEQMVAVLLQLPPARRAEIIGKILDSLGTSGAHAGWIEELRWQLDDWRAGVCLESVDDLLDDPTSL